MLYVFFWVLSMDDCRAHGFADAKPNMDLTFSCTHRGGLYTRAH
jgi:hypothetical protein